MTSRRTLGPLHVTRDRGEAHRFLAAIYPAELRWVTDEAVCASADPEAWWPEQGNTVADIKKLCQTCPLLEPCREYQLSQSRWGDFGGIWGGLNEPERREIRRKRRAA